MLPTFRYDYDMNSAMRSAITYYIHNKFGNVANMAVADQYEYALLTQGELDLLAHRDYIGSDPATLPEYPKVLVGKGGIGIVVADQEAEAKARTGGFNYPAPPSTLAHDDPQHPANLAAAGVINTTDAGRAGYIHPSLIPPLPAAPPPPPAEEPLLATKPPEPVKPVEPLPPPPAV